MRKLTLAVCGAMLLGGCGQKMEALPGATDAGHRNDPAFWVERVALDELHVALVLDASGSMAEAFDGSPCEAGATGCSSKWRELKSSVLQLVARNPRLSFALATFPAREACGPGALLMSSLPGPDAGAEISEALGQITPAGGSPIAATLFGLQPIVDPVIPQQPVPALVLLVADGFPNCNADEESARRGRECNADAASCSAPRGCNPTEGAGDSCLVQDNREGEACRDTDSLVWAVEGLRGGHLRTAIVGLGPAFLDSELSAVYGRAAAAGGLEGDGGSGLFIAEGSAGLLPALEAAIARARCLMPFTTKPYRLVSLAADSGEERELLEGADWSFSSDTGEVRLSASACGAMTSGELSIHAEWRVARL